MLWIGTGNGLERFDRNSFSFKHYQRDPENPASLSANRVYEVYVDSQNNLWVGTVAGLDRFDRETETFIHYQPEPGNPNSLSGPAVNSIFEDSEGNLWVGTWESGLNKFNPKTEEFTRYRYDARNKETISSDVILSIYQDTKGRLWIGTGGGGLNLYHPETDTFTYYLEKDGLPNGVVYGILEDSQGISLDEHEFWDFTLRPGDRGPSGILTQATDSRAMNSIPAHMQKAGMANCTLAASMD